MLEARGAYLPTTAEGIDARKGMVTRQETHRQTIDRLVDDLVTNARVFRGGGTEEVADNLRSAVQKAATAALVRLYPDFDLADDTRWKKVVDRAREGSGNPLTALGFDGDTKDHPACARVPDCLTKLGSCC